MPQEMAVCSIILCIYLDGLSLPMGFRKTAVEATLKEGKLTVPTDRRL